MYERERNILLNAFGHFMSNTMTKNKAVLAGGAIRSVFTRDTVNDYDLFFRSEDHRMGAMTDIRQAHGLLTVESEFETELSTSWSIKFRTGQHQEVQFIKVVVVDSIQQLLNSFDFTMCMGAYDFDHSTFILDDRFLLHNAQKLLVYKGSDYPICAMHRAFKFVNRGYRLPGCEMVRIAIDINNLKFNTWGDLKKQLLGIDTSYFMEIAEEFSKEGRVPLTTDSAISLAEFSGFVERFFQRFDTDVWNSDDTLPSTN